jgi:hypothetical protein
METKSLIPAVWNVPQIFRDRIGSKVGRQRAMSADGHLLLVLHQPPESDENERQGRLIWRAPDGTWSSNDQGSGANAVNRHLDTYAEAVQKWDELDEQAGSSDDYFAVLEGLAPLLRASRHLHQVLQEARQMLRDVRELINYRDRAYEIERTAELLYGETKNALDFSLVKQAEGQAAVTRRMEVSAHRLNLLAAFFFPLATLSGIFGVSLQHGLEELAPPLPFVILLACGLLSGIVLMRFLTRP